jgi:hypothetical protein
MSEDQARWMAELLATSIQVSGLSEEEIEAKLGWSPGTVGRLLEEDELDPEQVLEVLAELNGDSSWELGPDTEWDERTQVVTELMDRFHRLGYEATKVVPQEQQLSVLELEKRMEAVLGETFGKEESEEPEDG